MKKFESSALATLGIVVLAALLAFSFLGARGLWDPDEGRYTNVAVNMLESGNWLEPMRNDDVGHWTKPPLTYWLVASSIGAFGLTPFAARLPIALAYLGCIWLVFRLARRLAPGTESVAAVFYATMLLPFGASQFVSTDYFAAFFQTAALWAFAEAHFGRGHRALWMSAVWSLFALAFLAKGPPAVLGLLVLFAFEWTQPKEERGRTLHLIGIALFLMIALPWFVIVTMRTPGLLAYFLGTEVFERVASSSFRRHSEWYGWLEIYGPTLVLGTLPWTGSLWRTVRSIPRSARDWRDAAARHRDAPTILLVGWIAIPLVIFCIARSRLPLYILPLFAPIAVLAAMKFVADGRRLSPRVIAAWVALLLLLKAAIPYWPTHKDASVWAREIRARTPMVHEVVFVEDMVRYGLRLHLDAEVEKISLAAVDSARFNPEFDEDLATELREIAHEDGVVLVCKEDVFPTLVAKAAASGISLARLGSPFYGRVIARAETTATRNKGSRPN